MPAMTRTSGRRLTIAIWPMSSPFKARSPKPSPTNCRPSFRRAEKNAIEQRPTSDVAAFELYSRAKDLILNTGFSAISAQNLRSGIDLLNQALARDPSFFAAQCQLAYAHDTLYASHDHTPQRACLSRSGGARQRSSYGRMPAKRISPAPIIFTPPIATTTVRSLSSRLSAARCPMLLGSSS